MNRRVFIKNSFLTVALLIFSKGKLFAKVTPLDTLSLLQEDLLPLSKTLQSKDSSYMLKVLNHSHILSSHKQFIRNGVTWLNEESVKYFKNVYTKLSYEKRQELLKIVSQQKWGEQFIHSMLKYTIEAILGDPIYGNNKNQNGWKWINHETGYPQPKKAFL